MITLERLKECLNYDPETGIFTRLLVTASRIKIGDIAGTIILKKYRCITLDGKQYYAHRLAWFYMTGEWPKSKVHIDHKDGDGFNNKWVNLREATSRQNGVNSKVRINNKLGVKGISKNRKGYLVRICLGTYETLEEAIEVYNKAIFQYYGEFARPAEKPKVLDA